MCKVCSMNTTTETDKPITPPAFMATTRLKIILKDHIPESAFEIVHPRTSRALHAVENFTKSLVNFTKNL